MNQPAFDLRSALTPESGLSLRGDVDHSSDEVCASLIDVLQKERITTVFQPIFDLQTAEVFAYEALSRIVGPSTFQGPEDLFHAAIRFQCIPQLERLCIAQALRNAQRLGIEKDISFNICPSMLQLLYTNSSLKVDLVEKLCEIRDKVILELTERFYIHDNELFRKTISYYKRQGFKIAIDDLGSGFTGLQMLAELEPYLVKIDRSLISGIDKSTRKRMLLESIVSFCHKINSRVVAEGIETEQELEIVSSMKVDLGQGYLLARPAATIQECAPEVRSYLFELNMLPCSNHQNDNFVGSLAQYVEPVDENEKLEMVMDRFMSDGTLSSVPVVNGRIPTGILHKFKLYYKLGQQFGYALYVRKPVKNAMEPVLVFESNTPLEEVSRKVLSRDEGCIYDTAVITQNNTYFGILKIYNLLSRITEQKILLAMQANPLTGLPGNNLIKEQINDRLKENQLFAVMYFDVDNFKPFNDYFGFEQGDRIIRFLGNLLKECVTHWDPKAFVGHIGGDDFVVVCRSQAVEDLCRSIISRFDREVKPFHGDETVQRGYYESMDRRGHIQRFPLLSLSIAVVTTSKRVFASYGHLVSVASEVKKRAKDIPGSAVCIDQRQR